MTNLQDSSSIKFSYMLVSIAWFSSLIGMILVPVVSILPLISDSDLVESIDLNFPISTDVILFSPENTVSFMDIESATASARAVYVADNYFGSYLAVSLIALVSVFLVFWAVSQLRNILKDLKIDKVFIDANTNRIKKISIAILALSPMKWLYHMSLLVPFESYLQENSVAIEVGSADPGLITIGLLIYTLALVFERGKQQIKEIGQAE